MSAVESWGALTQRILRGMRGILGQRRGGQLVNYPAEREALAALFATVPGQHAARLFEYLEPPRKLELPRDAVACFFLQRFAVARPQALHVLLEKAGLPDRALRPRFAEPECPGTDAPHAVLLGEIIANGLHLAPMTADTEETLYALVRAVEASAAPSLLARIDKNSSRDDFVVFLRRHFTAQLPKMREILQQRVRAIRGTTRPPAPPTRPYRPAEASGAFETPENLPPFSHKDFLSGVDVRAVSELQRKLWPVQDAFVLYEYNFNVIEQHRARAALERAGMSQNELGSLLGRYRVAFAKMAAGLALNTLRHQRRMMLAWQRRFHGVGSTKDLAEDADLAVARERYAAGLDAEVRAVGAARDPVEAGVGFAAQRVYRDAERLTRQVLEVHGYPFANDPDLAWRHLLAPRSTADGGAAEQLRRTLLTHLADLLLANERLIRSLQHNSRWVYALADFVQRVLQLADLDKTAFRRVIDGAAKPNDPYRDLLFVAGLLLGLVSQNWALLALGVVGAVGEVVVIDLEEHNLTYAAYRLHLADEPPNAAWIFLAVVFAVGDAAEVAKQLAKAIHLVPKGELSAELIRQALNRLDPSGQAHRGLERALAEAADAERLFGHAFGPHKGGPPIPVSRAVAASAVKPIALDWDGFTKLAMTRIRRGERRFESMRRYLEIRAGWRDQPETIWQQGKKRWERALDAVDEAGHKAPRPKAKPSAPVRSFRKRSRPLLERMMAELPAEMATAYRKRYKELRRAIRKRRAEVAEMLPKQLAYTLKPQQRARRLAHRKREYGETLLNPALKDTKAIFRDWATVEILKRPGHPYELWISLADADGRLLHPAKYRDALGWREVQSVEAGHALDAAKGGTGELEELGFQDTVWNRMERDTRPTKRQFIDVDGIPTEFDTAILHHALGLLNDDDLFAALKKGFVKGWNIADLK